ncbi:MAG TPA: ABC-type transport auxiliary lipoprotein family protein [Steroidobacteraceae bacterium]|jgi:cholesterol transport system auxiliary component|nr:ABC-type transport auxiliary lipoprotein family protein [Steroidobacteraceae bacterium]
MRTAIVAAAAALCAGCFGSLKEPVPQPLVYRIEAPKVAAGAPLAADLKVDVGQVAPGLDSSGIATRWPGQRLDYVAGARWAEELPQLLEAALVESLQDSGRLRSVQGDFGRFRATHTLVVEVRRFEADYTGGGLPVAQVELTATIGKTDRRVLASFTVSASESAAANRQTALVAALDAAFARAASELAERTFAAIGEQPPAGS